MRVRVGVSAVTADLHGRMRGCGGALAAAAAGVCFIARGEQLAVGGKSHNELTHRTPAMNSAADTVYTPNHYERPTE
jgi:hypothetical protein